ncbi:MAG: hypothetical protein QNJ31_01830 [Candidatus Caenarcaniphilales bacterium]|nr:hypothetical protein [Candidatus Caenarcaniphilales bacterium]
MRPIQAFQKLNYKYVLPLTSVAMISAGVGGVAKMAFHGVHSYGFIKELRSSQITQARMLTLEKQMQNHEKGMKDGLNLFLFGGVTSTGAFLVSSKIPTPKGVRKVGAIERLTYLAVSGAMLYKRICGSKQ